MVGFKSVNVGQLSEESAKEWAEIITWAKREKQKKKDEEEQADQQDQEEGEG